MKTVFFLFLSFLSFAQCATISTQPLPQITCEGDSIRLIVGSSGGTPKSTCDFKCYRLRKGAYFFPLFLDTQWSSCGFYYCNSHTEWSKNKGIRPMLHSSSWHLCDGLQWGITEHHHAPCCSITCREAGQSLCRITFFAQCDRLFTLPNLLV